MDRDGLQDARHIRDLSAGRDGRTTIAPGDATFAGIEDVNEIWNEAMAGNGRNEETSQPGRERLSVVTVTYNSSRHLKAFLDSLQTGLDGLQDFEVVIADNASSDDSVAIALSHPIRPRVINVGWNSGYAGGINAAVATVGEDSTLLVLNPDVRLLPGAALLLVDRLLDPTVGVAVPRILDEAGRLTHSLRREPSLTTAWTDAVLGGGKLGTWIGTGEKISDPTRYTADGFADWAEGSALAISARAQARGRLGRVVLSLQRGS